MLKRSERLWRSLRLFIILLLLASGLFTLFSYITIRTNVNIINSSIDLIRGTASGQFTETLATIQQSVLYIYWIALAELIILFGGFFAAILAVNYLVGIYFTAAMVSLVDELTGIYNRRALYKILDQEIKRAERFKHPLTIIMVDIDFFKNYNDINGHIAGDYLLQRISKIMGRKIRDVDTLGRYGGEEFLIILPETSHEGAAKVGERIRKTVEEAKFKGQESQPKGKITISLGLVTFHGEYKSRAHLIHSADELLYRAKELGRNQLIKAYYKKESI